MNCTERTLPVNPVLHCGYPCRGISPLGFVPSLLGVLGRGSMTPANTRYEPSRFELDWPSRSSINADVRRRVNERLALDAELLIVQLQEIAVTTAVDRSISQSATSPFGILRIEAEWAAASSLDTIVVSRTDEACSHSLERLGNTSSDFVEILATDSRGLVVCQSRMTERHYQRDQAWWRECVEIRSLSHSRLVYDENADALALSILALVLDPSTAEPIGVARALLRRQVGSRQ